MSGDEGLWSYLCRARWELLVGLTLSIVGFVAALSIDSALDEREERATVAALLEGVKEEAEDNRHIYRNSFAPHADSGLVVREFTLLTVRAVLSNPLFLRHSDQAVVELLTNYARHLDLANGFARTTLDLRTSGNDAGWATDLVQSWKLNLTLCERSIQAVLSHTN